MPSVARHINFKEAQERYELEAAPASFSVDGNGACNDTIVARLYHVKSGEKEELQGNGVTLFADGTSVGNFTLPLSLHASAGSNDAHNAYVSSYLSSRNKNFSVSAAHGSNALTIPIIRNGEKGATPRVQAWSDLPVGYHFYQGTTGEDYKDTVIYNGNYYTCIKSHVKTASNYPTSANDTSNGYWKLGEKIELVATNLLLAAYALVKNLGVEAIEMRDSKGEVLFEAKDGNVTCKTGAFENITVSGTVKANLLYGKVVQCDFTKSGNNTYTIDPVKEPGTTFVPGTGTNTNSEILLPKASDYDGLELNVSMLETGPLTRSSPAGWGITIGCSSSTDKIYIKKDIDYDQYTTINNNKVYLANILEPYTAETEVWLSRNRFAKFISLKGAWWAISGDFYKSGDLFGRR